MGLPKSGDAASRFSAYVEGLASVIGHADRAKPLRDYCIGLMMPGERKSVCGRLTTWRGADGCRLWRRHRSAYEHHGARIELCSRHYATNVGMGARHWTAAAQETGRAAVDLQSCCGVMASTNRYRSRSLRLPCRQRLGARSRGGKPRQSRCPHALPACAFVQRIETTGSLRVDQRSGC